MRSHRIALVALAAVTAVVAAGCSQSSPDTPASGSPSGGATHYPLTVTQPDGSTATIATAPTRIVTVDNPQLSMDDVVAVGVVPVGALLYPPGTPGYDARGIPTELSEQVPSITSVGTAPNKPDLQRIVALHPDLIVGVDGKGIADLAQLEAIAPVVSATPSAGTGRGVDTLEWVAQVRQLGDVLDRRAQADAFIARFEAAAAPVRKAVAGKTVDLVLPSPNGSTFTRIGATFPPAGQLLTYLGLTLPTSFPGYAKVINGDHANYSIERAGDLTGQYLVLAHVVSTTDAVYQTFLASPVVAKLPSVTDGRVIRTGGDEAIGKGYLTAGPIGQMDAFEGIQQAFTGTGKSPS